MKLDITTLPIKAEEFFSYLKNQIGYKKSTLMIIQQIVNLHFIPIIVENGGDINKAYDAYKSYINESNLSYSRKSSCKISSYRFVVFLKNQNYELSPLYPKYVEPTLAYLKDSLNNYLSSCTLNKENTIKKKFRFLNNYLKYLEENGISTPTAITIELSIAFLNEQINNDYYGIIRGYLYYLYNENILDKPIYLLIPSPKKHKPLPSVYSLKELEAIDLEFDKESEIGLRDYCVFLLASELGIRIGDIVKLRFTNIDFTNKIIKFTQTKTGVDIILPISDKFIDSLKLYINNYRNDKLSFLFVTTLPPIRPISESVIRFGFSRVIKRAGIEFNGRKHGPHSFRSSLVSNMINNEVPYEVVRKVVGHTSETAINHYAKIDIEKLRIFALEPLDFSKTIESMLGGENDV